MTYEEYERQNEMDDAIQDDIDGIVENMDFDQYADDCWYDFGKLSEAVEAMTEEERDKVKEIAPAFYAEIEKMHEDYEDCSCIPAIKAWNALFQEYIAGTGRDYSVIGKALPKTKKAFDDAHDLVLEYMERIARNELPN
jgi:hypothetical protein